MKASFMLVGIIVLYIVVGAVAVETGLTEPIFNTEDLVPDSPDGSGSFWEKISSALAPLAWGFNAMGSLLQLAAYSSDGIPTTVNTLIIAPLGLVIIFTVIKFARGTGD